MNWLKILSLILQAGPEVLQLIAVIVKAFQALPGEHQDAIRKAVAVCAAKAP